MSAEPRAQIPILTDEISTEAEAVNLALAQDIDTLIAELQTQLASNTFALADEIMRKAFAEMEASVFEEISGRLRRELPELIDRLLRERLGSDQEY